VTDKTENENAETGLSLQDWQQSLFHDHVLPSGLAVTMRKVSLLDLATEGGIPAPLLALISGEQKEIEFKGEQMADVLKAFDITAKASLVEPEAIEGRSTETQVGLKDLSFQDKEFIFEKANEDVMKLKPFRGEEGESA
jgi:hypothetical protein